MAAYIKKNNYIFKCILYNFISWYILDKLQQINMSFYNVYNLWSFLFYMYYQNRYNN